MVKRPGWADFQTLSSQPDLRGNLFMLFGYLRRRKENKRFESKKSL